MDLFLDVRVLLRNGLSIEYFWLVLRHTSHTLVPPPTIVADWKFVCGHLIGNLIAGCRRLDLPLLDEG